MSNQKKQSTEAAVREIRRRSRRKFSPEEKIRIVLEGLRGEQSVADYLALPYSQDAGVGMVASGGLSPLLGEIK